MPLRWSFEALALVEYNSLQALNENVRDLNNVVGFLNDTPLVSLLTLTGMSVFFVMVAYVRLRWIKGYEHS